MDAAPASTPAEGLALNTEFFRPSVQRQLARPPRVLIAEDHPTNRRVTSLLLEKLGYEVEVTKDGREALDAWRRTRHEIILMDCQMPTMDGFEATRQVRQAEAAEPPSPSGPTFIVALTANAMAANRDACRQAGMDGFITKPVQSESLRRVMQYANALPKAGSPSTVRTCIKDLHDALGPEAVVELLTAFLDDTPHRLAELRTLAAGKDAPTFARAAHSIAGSCGIFGLIEMRDLGLSIEDMARTGAGKQCNEAINRLEAQFRAVADELEQIRDAAADEAEGLPPE